MSANDPKRTSAVRIGRDAQCSRCHDRVRPSAGGAAGERREFIMLVGGSAAAWPLAARAQPRERVRLVGLLEGISADAPGAKARHLAFLEGLQQLGWTPGRNVRIDVRWGGGDEAETRKHAAELIALAPDVILVGGTTASEVVLKTTHSIPIVFVIVPDPVGSGYVKTLSQPGGNATGFMMFEYNLCGSGWNCSRRSRQA